MIAEAVIRKDLSSRNGLWSEVLRPGLWSRVWAPNTWALIIREIITTIILGVLEVADTMAILILRIWSGSRSNLWPLWPLAGLLLRKLT